jgi:hypothetical protein
MLQIRIKIMRVPEFKTNRKQVMVKAASVIRRRIVLARESL